MHLMLYGGDCLVARDLLFASEEETKQARIAADISPAAANLTLALIDCALARSLYRVGKANDPQSCAMIGTLQFMRRSLGHTASGGAGVSDSLSAARARFARAAAYVCGGGASDLALARAEAFTVVCFLDEAGFHREVLAAIVACRALGGGHGADAGGCELELGMRAAELRALVELDLRAEFDAAVVALDECKRGNLAVCAGPGCGHQGSYPEPGALSRCGGCGRVAYCSAACQRAAWKGHKADCKVSAGATVT